MRKTLAIAGLWLCLGPWSFAQNPALPSLRNRLLREELALAKTTSLYFVILLESRTMSVKAGGLTLREWKLEKVHFWGAVPSLSAMTLEKKSALFPPKRKEIIPVPEENTGADEENPKEKKKAESKKEAYEPEALELKDMPSRFVLLLSDGTRIYIRPRAHQFFPWLGNVGHSFSWYFWVPLKNLWYRLKRRPFSAIDIKLATREDSRSLYWTLAEGQKGLIFPL